MAEIFPVGAAYPEYTNILFPEIWSPRLNVKFYLATVFGEICNTDHEDEIQAYGDTVTIRTTPDIVINEYQMGVRLEYQAPEPSTVQLLIDKGLYYATRMDDVARLQADYNALDDWANDAAMQMKINIDGGILADVYADADSTNAGATAGAISSSYNLGASGSPVAVTKTNVVEYLQDMSSCLDENNVPPEDRWGVFPAWFCNLIGKSDLKDASLSGDDESMARNGRVGRIANMTLYMSNQIATSSSGGYTAYETMFGHKSAITFASQLTDNEGPFSHPDYIGKFAKGLNVYGYKVIKAEGLGHFHCRKG